MSCILIYSALAFAVGIWTQFEFPVSFLNLFCAGLFLIAVCAFIKRERIFVFCFTLLVFVLGMMSISIGQRDFSNALDLNGQSLKTAVMGRIISPVKVKRSGDSVRCRSFDMRLLYIKRERIVEGESRRLWEETAGVLRVTVFHSVKQFSYGDELRMWGEISVPEKPLVPGMFDYAGYLQNRFVCGTMQVFGERSVACLAKEFSLRETVIRKILFLREDIDAYIAQKMEYPYSALLSAFLLGQRANLDKDLRESFVLSGSIHLLAISGLHMAIIAGVIYYLSGFVRHHRGLRLLFVLIVMWFYVVFAGFSYPVMRSAVMGSLTALALFSDFRRNVLHLLSAAFICLLVYRPESLFQTGFQLSFLSLLSIIYFVPELEAVYASDGEEDHYSGVGFFARKYIRGSLMVSAAVLVGVAPLLAYKFSLVSFSSFLANLVMIPVSAGVIISGLFSVLTGFFLGLDIFLFIPHVLLRVLCVCASVSSHFPCSHYFTGHFSPYVLISYYLVCFIGWKYRRYFGGRGVLLWIMVFGGSLLMTSAAHSLTSPVEAAFFGGRAAGAWMIKKGGSVKLLVNPGSDGSARNVIIPFLKHSGVNGINMIAASSGYSLSVKGASAVFNVFECGSFWGQQGEPVNAGLDNLRMFKGESVRLSKNTSLKRISIPDSKKSGFSEKESTVDVIEIDNNGTTLVAIDRLSPDLAQYYAQNHDFSSPSILFCSNAPALDHCSWRLLLSSVKPTTLISAGRVFQGLPSLCENEGITYLNADHHGVVQRRFN